MNPILIPQTPCQPKTSSFRVVALAASACALMIAGLTTSCSTTKGFGRDVEKTGDAIQNAASR